MTDRAIYLVLGAGYHTGTIAKCQGENVLEGKSTESQPPKGACKASNPVPLPEKAVPALGPSLSPLQGFWNWNWGTRQGEETNWARRWGERQENTLTGLRIAEKTLSSLTLFFLRK